jgi:L-ascorbate metabolism protein UlaG (beta-lactamase superfamily)
MSIEITHTINAGVLLSNGDAAFLVDGLFSEKAANFSTPAAGMINRILNGRPPFAHISGILATHLHIDHGNPKLMARLSDGSVPVVAPRTKKYASALKRIANPLRLLDDAPIESFELAGVSVKALCTKHDGDPSYAIEHYSYLFEFPEGNVFIAGDVAADDAVMRSVLEATETDTAIMNFPIIMRPAGRALILDCIRPRRLLLHHLPLPEDDIFGYAEATRKMLEKWKDKLPPTEILL